jgi:hypothetical protein
MQQDEMGLPLLSRSKHNILASLSRSWHDSVLTC